MRGDDRHGLVIAKNRRVARHDVLRPILLDDPQDIAAEVYAAAVDPSEGLAADAALDRAGFATVLRLRAEFVGKAPAAPETYLDPSYYRDALAEQAG